MVSKTVVVFCVLITQLKGAPTGSSSCLEEESEPAHKKSRSDLPPVVPRCELYFSEVKLARSIDDVDSFPFIEFAVKCQQRPGPKPNNVLSSYKLFILDGNPLSVVMMFEFSNFPVDEDKSFVVLGSPKVPFVDVSLGGEHVQTTFSRTIDHQMLPFLGGKTYTLFLTSGITKNEIKPFNLYIWSKGPMSPRMLKTEQINLLIAKAVDVVILGPGNVNLQTQFSYFWKQLDTPKTMFSTEWTKLQTSELDHSLNVCIDNYKGFDASVLQTAIESPGEINKCQTPEMSDNEDLSVLEETFSESQQQLHKLPNDYLPACKSAFDQSWIKSCEERFPKRENLLQIPSIQHWLRFITEPLTCKFVCGPCTNYLKYGFRPDLRNLPNIINKGFYSNDIYANGEAIKTHSKSDVHIEALEFSDRVKSASSEQDINKVIQDYEKNEMRRFNATMNVVLFVYAEVKAGVSFKTHETLMVALRLMGSNVGWIHHTDDAAQKITKIISRTLHNNLLQNLVDEQAPFSLLADSSSNANQPFLAVYLQTLKDDRPVTFFYNLIYMSNGEKARDMTNSLISQIRDDDKKIPGFEEYFKSKITSLSTDGASVMVAGEKSLRAYLIEYIERAIPNIVCLAHNLDRAYKVGIKATKEQTMNLNPVKAYDSAMLWQLRYFEQFEKCINELYTFYASWGYKRWMHFLQTAEDQNVDPKRLKHSQHVRWSDSLFRSVEAVHHNLYPLEEDLEKLIYDKDFDKNARNTAITLHQRLTDKTFILVLHDLMDILTTFKISSRLFQESSSIIVGKAGIVYNTINSLIQLKTLPGDYLRDFLSSTVCIGVCDEGDCSMDMFDSCGQAIISGIKLEHQYPVVLHYSGVRSTILENLISSLKSYFKIDLLESFETFNPEKINFQATCDDSTLDVFDGKALEQLYLDDSTTPKLHAYTSFEQRIQFICNFYHFDNLVCNRFLLEWSRVLQCLSRSDDASKLKNMNAANFWPLTFQHCSEAWTELTKRVVRMVLVTSFSSAECERGFSIMNNIKTKGRSRMEKDTVDSVMRVKINGPEIEKFNAYEHTIEFLKAHVAVDDTNYLRRRSGQHVSQRRLK